jgi:mycothiol synthase
MTTIAAPSGSVQRPFDPESDVVLIRDFIATLVSQVGQNLALHIGDWLWQLHLREDRLPAAREDLRIWTGHDGTIQGFCWFRSNHMEIQVDPAASPHGEIEREMLAWALARQEADPDGARADLLADAFEHDARKIAILTDLGFRVTDDDRYDIFRQTLNAQPVHGAVPVGAEVRSVDPDRDLDDRVAIHQEVWHPSKITATSYAAVRAAPGYLPELDLIAVAPDGMIAAYCTCWYDPVNRIGEFEPVGARAAYRRQGYGLAIMHEGLRRLQRLGATEAIVLSSATNTASYGLYSRSGFTAAGQYHSYVRPASAGRP